MGLAVIGISDPVGFGLGFRVVVIQVAVAVDHLAWGWPKPLLMALLLLSAMLIITVCVDFQSLLQSSRFTVIRIHGLTQQKHDGFCYLLQVLMSFDGSSKHSCRQADVQCSI